VRNPTFSARTLCDTRNPLSRERRPRRLVYQVHAGMETGSRTKCRCKLPAASPEAAGLCMAARRAARGAAASRDAYENGGGLRCYDAVGSHRRHRAALVYIARRLRVRPSAAPRASSKRRRNTPWTGAMS
jgi:hypothetical protein